MSSNGWGSIYNKSHWGDKKKKTTTEKVKDFIKRITKIK